MDVIFSQLKQKDVINLVDGKHLGRVCDITFTFPEGKVTGLTVTGSKGFKFSRQEIFLPLGSVVKIGEDAVLVKYGAAKEVEKECPPPKSNKCPPPKNPPECPPQKNCPPPCPPHYPQPYGGQSRRSLDEYE